MQPQTIGPEEHQIVPTVMHEVKSHSLYRISVAANPVNLLMNCVADLLHPRQVIAHAFMGVRVLDFLHGPDISLVLSRGFVDVARTKHGANLRSPDQRIDISRVKPSLRMKVLLKRLGSLLITLWRTTRPYWSAFRQKFRNPSSSKKDIEAF